MSDDEEDYGFTYSDEEDGGPGGESMAEDPSYTTAENFYYTAKKAKLDGDIAGACAGMRKLFELDPEGGSTKVGELKVKAMKQLAKMRLGQHDFGEALAHYKCVRAWARGPPRGGAAGCGDAPFALPLSITHLSPISFSRLTPLLFITHPHPSPGPSSSASAPTR